MLAASRAAPHFYISRMKPFHTIFTIAAALFLSACQDQMPPLVEGTVKYLSSDNTQIERQLTQEQLQSLTDWLANSSSNWHGCFATPPGGTPIITLRHANGTFSSLTLLKFPNSTSQTTGRCAIKPRSAG